MSKQEVGEYVFAVARKLYKTHAAKITGMIVEAILNLQSSRSTSEIQEILNSEIIIAELVNNLFSNILIYIEYKY